MASEHQQAERLLRDRDAASYERWYRRTKGIGFDAREVAALTREVGATEGAVLDVGGGTGRVARALSVAGRVRVVILDLSEASLLVAKSRGAGLGLQASAAEWVPVMSGSFDVVIACQVLQHLDEDELGCALGEFRRVVSPGGSLVVAGYNGSARRYRDAAEERYDNGLWVFRRPPEAVAAAAARAGFSLQRQRYYSLVPLHRLPAAAGMTIDRLACWVRPAAKVLAGYVVQRYGAD